MPLHLIRPGEEKGWLPKRQIQCVKRGRAGGDFPVCEFENKGNRFGDTGGKDRGEPVSAGNGYGLRLLQLSVGLRIRWQDSGIPLPEIGRAEGRGSDAENKGAE